MTRLSEYLLPTVKQPPADAEAISHKLMVRAGLIRQMGAGLWTYLPAGWRVQRKVEQIIREEMDAAGAQEVLMPLMQPVEIWKQTGRDAIDELFRLEDRKGSPMVLAMTHEEAMTFHASREVRSYRDLPFTLYQFQLKGRDEPRPRAGVLRTREFIMKDAYSFDRDEDGLSHSYEIQAEAYKRIFDRSGLEWYMVESDVGMMGGSGAHEFMAPCAAGENEVARAGSYAANVEIASAKPADPRPGPELPHPEEVATPGATTIEEVSELLGVHPSAMLKAMPMITEEDGKPLLVLLRGDHRLNEIKLQNALGAAHRQASEDEIESLFGSVAGFIGPVDMRVPVIADEALREVAAGYVAGANRPDLHLKGVAIGRDFEPQFADVRSVEAGDFAPSGATIEIVPAIEIGNIFKLGTRYSEALGATYLDESGVERPIVMGSYGIGPARVAAAAVEQLADEAGIVWPKSIAPFAVHLVTLGKEPGAPEREQSELLYEQLLSAGVETIYDDRDAGPGAKFADAELLGCPLRVTVGKKGLEQGEYEVQIRRGRESLTVPIDGGADAIVEMLGRLN